MNEKETILVTGATGNVGSHVAAGLHRAGYQVRVGVRGAKTIRALPVQGVEICPFDFTAPETHKLALRGVSKVFLVRPPAISNISRDMLPFLEATKATGIEQIVFLSLLGAEKNRVVPHHKIESWLMDSGVAYTLLRAGFFMQNLSTTHRAEIKNRDEIFIPAGEGKTAFIDARDIAAVAVKSLTEPGHKNRAYALTGAEALTYGEVAAKLSAVLGREIRYRQPSLPAFVRQLLAQGEDMGFALVVAAIYTTTRFGLAEGITADVTHLLGRPPISLQTYLQDYAAVWGKS